MRIAILRADLPSKFNKVAKYMGRHWPSGKIAHNKSRETLSVLLGYNSYYELDQVADNQVLPEQIQWNKIVSSMVVRAMIHCDIALEEAQSLFAKLPLKELSIYKVTDKYMEEKFIRDQRSSDPKFQHMIFDEAHLLQNYKSPSLVINQYKDGEIPPYTYAVSKNGLIFSSSRYERLIGQVADITDDILESESISRREFIDRYIMPKAWLPVIEYINEKDSRGSLTWRTPHQVQVYQSEQGYLLYNSAFEAYYPNIYRDFDSVAAALESLYLAKPVEEVEPLSGKVMNWWLCRDVESDYKGYTQTADFEKFKKVKIDGQLFSLSISYSTLGDCGSIPSLSGFEVKSGENDYQIPADFIDPAVLTEYWNLFKTLPFIRKRIECMVKALDVSDLRTVFTRLASINPMPENDDFRIINEDEDYCMDGTERGFELGGRVLEQYPELEDLIDQTYLGNSYQLFSQDEYYNSRSVNVWGCDSREPEFLVFLFLSLLGAVKLHEHEEYSFIAGGAILIHYFRDFLAGSFEVDALLMEFKTSQSIQKKFVQRWKRLQRVNDYYKFLSSQDVRYLSNGTPSPYTEKSGTERFIDMMRLFRKTSAS